MFTTVQDLCVCVCVFPLHYFLEHEIYALAFPQQNLKYDKQITERINFLQRSMIITVYVFAEKTKEVMNNMNEM